MVISDINSEKLKKIIYCGAKICYSSQILCIIKPIQFRRYLQRLQILTMKLVLLFKIFKLVLRSIIVLIRFNLFK